MPEICVIPPAGEPLHVEEAKWACAMDSAEDNLRVRGLIAAARGDAETETRRQFVHARWQLSLDRFPCGAIRLPHSPLLRVVSIQYVDTAGVTQTVSTADYVVNKAETPGVVAPAFGKIWPVALPQSGSVTITYDAGYASPVTVASAPGTEFRVTGPVTWSVGDRVRFYCSGGFGAALPAPLSEDSSYLIASNPSSGVYTITDEAGNGITFTNTGSGTGRSFIGVVPAEARAWMLAHVRAAYDQEVMPSYTATLLDGLRTSLP